MHKEKGLTLVEVLISLVILVIGILAVLTMHTTSIQNNKIAREMTEAMHHANKAIETIISNPIDYVSDFNDDYDIGNGLNPSSPEYSIRIEPPSPLEELEEQNGLIEFELIVQWSSFGKTRDVRLPFKKSSVGMNPTLTDD